MRDEQIKHMVNRFLAWNLPDDFSPDGGISFQKIANEGLPQQFVRQPSGTNLLDARQADAMVRYMLDGLPTSVVDALLEKAIEADSVGDAAGFTQAALNAANALRSV